MNNTAAVWRKSSYSGTNGGECVEVAFENDRALIRDSKFLRDPANNPAAQPLITMNVKLWPAFLSLALGGTTVAAGVPIIQREAESGEVRLRSATGVCLTYTAAEWAAFISGARDGEFAA
ncbi:DUF397 domain-containing protein [Nocardia sp. NBC_00511]|uniref:DUF397 domain-containing protein n=1 Tax=Nocardia sp. NBC_00511 TaxID=2903591 RepID=UPI0030E0645D